MANDFTMKNYFKTVFIRLRIHKDVYKFPYLKTFISNIGSLTKHVLYTKCYIAGVIFSRILSYFEEMTQFISCSYTSVVEKNNISRVR